MTDEIKTSVEKNKSERTKATASAVLGDGSIVEMLHRPDEQDTLLCVFKDGEIRYEPRVFDNGQHLVPYSPGNNLLAHEVVLFPSEPREYGTEQKLRRHPNLHPHLRGRFASLREDCKLLCAF